METVVTNDLMFANDIVRVIAADSEENFQHNIEIVRELLEQKNKRINMEKTASIIISFNSKTHNIKTEEITVE